MTGLIGRDAEMATIIESLKRPDVAGIVLVGDPGVGKTAILDAGVQLAADAGFVTIRIAGNRALSDLPLAALTPLMPRRPAGDAGDLVELRDTIRDEAAGRPIVLGVDDAHLLDDASAAVVHQLAADLTVFVIGTVRAGEPTPDAVTALWKDRLVTWLEIGPLDRAALPPFAEATLGGPLDADVADEVWRRSIGNPLFVRELLLAARDAGSLVERHGRWSRVGDLPAPTTVTELLRSRLASLDEAELRAVRLVALGGTLDVDVLEQLVDADALVRLESARLLTADEHGGSLEVGFTHPLHADAVRQATGRLVARQLRRELADVLEASGGGDTDDVLRIVTLRLESGGHTAPVLLARAARIALRRNDAPLAERLATATFATSATLASATVLATALAEQGRHQEAIEALTDPAIDVAAASPLDRFRAALMQATIEFWGLGRAGEALGRIAAARAAGPDEWRVELDAMEASIEASRSRPVPAMRIAEATPDVISHPLGAGAVLGALLAAGRPDEALATIAPPPEAAGGRWAIAGSMYAFVLLAAGRLREAGDLAIDRWESAMRASSHHARVAWSIVLGATELAQGRTAAAARWFDEAAQVAPLTNAGLHGQRWALGGALYCAAQVGDLAAARALAARLDDLPPHEAQLHELLGLRGRAWLVAAEGDVDAATAELLRLAREARTHGRHGHVVELLTDVARLGRAGPAAAALDDDHSDGGDGGSDDTADAGSGPLRVDGMLLPVMIDSVRAVADRDATALALAAERFHDIGAAVLAAEAASGAAAILDADRDDPRSIAAARRRAQQLRVAVSDLATPALTLVPVDLPLSRREREIATLVARGRTSREVADELVIGVRTVESHLSRIFDKLGVRSRTELPAALGITAAADPAGTPAAPGSADMVGAP